MYIKRRTDLLVFSFIKLVPINTQDLVQKPNSFIQTLSKMSFQYYSGPASAFPPKSTWKDFNTLFDINKPTMQETGDTGEDIGRIYNAIVAAAKLGVEERVILCIIMQESRGNVGVETPNDPDGNPTGGLMQAEGSPGFPGRHGLSQVRIRSLLDRTASFCHARQQVNGIRRKKCN